MISFLPAAALHFAVVRKWAWRDVFILTVTGGAGDVARRRRGILRFARLHFSFCTHAHDDDAKSVLARSTPHPSPLSFSAVPLHPTPFLPILLPVLAGVLAVAARPLPAFPIYLW